MVFMRLSGEVKQDCNLTISLAKRLGPTQMVPRVTFRTARSFQSALSGGSTWDAVEIQPAVEIGDLRLVRRIKLSISHVLVRY